MSFYWHACVLVSCGIVSVDPLLPGRYGAPDYSGATGDAALPAELENLKSQLHPHFLFNSLHTIGILMQEDVDAASHLLVCLGDLLRMALERRENEITLQSELEFVGKYLEIEQTRFH